MNMYTYTRIHTYTHTSYIRRYVRTYMYANAPLLAQSGVHILGEDACELIHYGTALAQSKKSVYSVLGTMLVAGRTCLFIITLDVKPIELYTNENVYSVRVENHACGWYCMTLFC